MDRASLFAVSCALFLQFHASTALASHYRFPWPEGQTATVTQSWCSKCSGNGHCSSGLEYAIDFALPAGTPVLAAYEGTVAAVVESDNEATCDLDGAWGNYVIINHGDGSWTKYAHLQYQSVPVSVGDYVCAGRQIGTVGCTGRATGPHIHFQVQHGGSVTDPSVSFTGFVETDGAIPNCNSGTAASQNRRVTNAAGCFVAAKQGQSQNPLPGGWVFPNSNIAMSVTYRNIGGATWKNGVTSPQYIELRSVDGGCGLTNGALAHSSWITVQRITAADQASVPRMSDAVFSFIAKAPSTTGYYPLVQWVGPYAAGACVNGWAGVNFEVRVDGTPPTVTHSGGAPPGSYTSDQTILFQATDANSGVRGFSVGWDDPGVSGPNVIASTGSTTLGAMPGGSGTHTLYVRAWDNAQDSNGNVVGNSAAVNLGNYTYTPNPSPCGPPLPNCTTPAIAWKDVGNEMASMVTLAEDLPTREWAAVGRSAKDLFLPGARYRVGFEYRLVEDAPVRMALAGVAPDGKPADRTVATVSCPVANGAWHPFWSAPFSITNEQLESMPTLRLHLDSQRGNVEIRDLKVWLEPDAELAKVRR